MSTVTEARIEADPTVPIIRITRDFAGTPEQLLRRTPTRRSSPAGSGRTPSTARSTSGTRGPVAPGATSPAGTTRSTASAAASTTCGRTASCRRSRGRACRTRCRWRPSSSRTWATAAPGCTPVAVRQLRGSGRLAAGVAWRSGQRGLRRARRPAPRGAVCRARGDHCRPAVIAPTVAAGLRDRPPCDAHGDHAAGTSPTRCVPAREGAAGYRRGGGRALPTRTGAGERRDQVIMRRATVATCRRPG